MANNAFAAFPPLRRLSEQPEIHPACLDLPSGFLRRDGNAVLQQFVRIWERIPIPCSHGRGMILFYLKWTRSSPQHPFQETQTIVVVKKLFKCAINPESQEDPYQEIHLMQQDGDDQHVTTILEALFTEKYLYLVMPWLGHDLLSTMWYPPIPRRYPIVRRTWTPAMVRVLLLNLKYFQNHALVLRDVSSDNILCSVHNSNHFPHIDLAMGLQCNIIHGIPQRISAGQPWCGKWPFTPPEALLGGELGFGFDVWSMAVTILTIAIGEQYIWDLRYLPYRLDDMYNFLILRGALNNPEILMELANELNNTNAAEYRHYVRKLRSLVAIDTKLRDLLARMLMPNPADRPTIDVLLSHPYFTT